MNRLFVIFISCLIISGCSNGDDGDSNGGDDCATLNCQTSKYNLLLADVDFTQANPVATNIRVLASSGYQDMTQPRVSPDNRWVAYTTYHITNVEGCASLDRGYMNTEIRVTRLSGSETRTIIQVVDGELNSNNCWYGSDFEFTFCLARRDQRRCIAPTRMH